MREYLDELFSLSGRAAVVTGGSSGIGRTIADSLGRAGAQVVLVARREDALARAVDELRSVGVTAAHLTADLGDRDAVARVADRVPEFFGDPDILVTSAAVNLRPPLEALTVDDWDRTMRVNLDAPFLLGQRWGPRMAERGWGRIIHVASQQTVRAFGNSGAYGASKGGVVALTRSQAEAWSSRGVCCNAIAPGVVRTPLTREVFADPERAAALASRTLVGRNGELDDFRGMAVFLASRASGYITGQILFVDGGFSAH